MTEVICISGFLGSGKTTLLNKILPLCLTQNKVAVLENDFGDTGIDAGLIAESGAKVRELASGCICCSLRGELKSALAGLIAEENPAIVFIEPSGIGRSSDILSTLKVMENEGSLKIGNIVNLLEASNFEDYLESFGDFYGDQIASARTILFSHQQGLSREKLDNLIAIVSEMNPQAACLLSDWLKLPPETLWDFIKSSSGQTLSQITNHNHTPNFAQSPLGVDIFSSWSGFPAHSFRLEKIESILNALAEGTAGRVLRAKGFCRAADDSGWRFDYLKGHCDIKAAGSVDKGRVLVIGQNLNPNKLAELFRA